MSSGLQTIGEEFMPVVVDDHFLIQADGLRVKGKPSFHDWEMFWKKLRSMEKGIQFAIGDAIKLMRAQLGEKADQIISAATGWSDSTVRAYEWTADKVPQEVRHMDTLSYSHHQAVAKLPPKEQTKWLDKAATGDGTKEWTVAALKAHMKSADTGVEASFWLLVRCKDAADRDQLSKRLEAEGYTTTERGA